MYNPFTLQKKYDPKCIFVKKYYPELKNIPNEHLLNWDKYHNKYDICQPIVDYSLRRNLAIKFFT